MRSKASVLYDTSQEKYRNAEYKDIVRREVAKELNPFSREFTSDFFQLMHMNFCNTYRILVILVNK